MHKIYSLLRNNKQTGPYSLEELVAQSLKPLDLVWVQGRSAGWSYPTEVNDLKAYVHEPASPMLPTAPNENSTVSLSNTQETISSNKLDSKPASAHIYISLPAKPRSVAQSSTDTMPVVSDGGATLSFEERVEKMRQRIVAVENGEGAKDETEIKYSRSLEDIKDEYTHWMQDQKKKSRFSGSRKPLFIGALTIGIAIASFFLAQWMLQKEAPGLSTDTANIAGNNNSNTATGNFNALEKTIEPTDAIVEGTDNTNEPPGETASLQKKKATAIQNSKQESTEPVIAEKVSAETPTPQTVALAEEKIPEPSVPLAQQIKLTARYIPGNENTSIDGLNVTLFNSSQQVLKVVAVDVFYHNGDIKVVDKETLYFSNVAPHSSYTLKAPGHKNANKAYCEIGLISSAAGGIYFARQ